MSITIKKIRSLLELLNSSAVINVSEVAKQTGISRRTIDRKVEKISLFGQSIEELLSLPDHKLKKLFASKPRKEFVEPDFEEAFIILNPHRAYKKGMKPTIESVWEDYANTVMRDLGLSIEKDELPDCCMSLNTFRRKYNEFIGKKKAKYIGLSDTASIGEVSAGALMEIDGVGDRLLWMDWCGVLHNAVLFVAVLKYSGLIFVYASSRLRAVDWANFIIHALNYFGGVPAAIKSDNDTALTIRYYAYSHVGHKFLSREPNPTMKYLANAYKFDWLLTGVRAPREKGMVERFVHCSEDFVATEEKFKTTKFKSLDEINVELLKLTDKFNNKIVKGGYSHRSFFEGFEKEFLMPLPLLQINYLDITSHKVGVRGYVRYKGNNYFVGHEYDGLEILACSEDGKHVDFYLQPNLKKIITYKIYTGTPIRVHNIKDPKFMSAAEKYLSRGLEDFLKSAEKYPAFKEELCNFFRHVYANFVLNDIDKTNFCNRTLSFCEAHCVLTNELKYAFNYILENNVLTVIKVNEVLKASVIAKHQVKQITPKSELLLQMQRDQITQKRSEDTLRHLYDSELSRLQRDDEDEGQEGNDYE